MADVIKNRVGDQLKNIDALLVRDEYKVRIYADYFLSSIRYLLSVHDLHKAQIKALDDLTHSYLKRWLGLPRCASWAIIHDSHGLNIKSIDHLYKECRCLTLSSVRFFSDGRARHALDVKEEREAQWRRKFSSAIYAKGLIQEVVSPVTVVSDDLTNEHILNDSHDSWSSLETDGILSPPPPSSPPSSDPAPAPVPPSSSRQPDPRKQLKRKVQAGLKERVNDFWKEKIGQYVMQGDYLALAMEENGCLTWRSYMWDIPQGVLKFAINAGINTLPTFDNLKRWGKRVSDRCPFCGNIQTLAHVLSNCSVALDQGRFTWRHNSVLSSIIELIRPLLHDGFSLYSDLPGFQAPHGGTIPPHVLTTALKPDLFLLNESLSTIIIFELTCPWDSNITRSHDFKEQKYSALVADLSRDYTVSLFSVEISARGFITSSNKARLKTFAFKCCSDTKLVFKSLVRVCSKASLLSSYSIFSARREPSWNNPPPLTVR